MMGGLRLSVISARLCLESDCRLLMLQQAPEVHPQQHRTSGPPPHQKSSQMTVQKQHRDCHMTHYRQEGVLVVPPVDWGDPSTSSSSTTSSSSSLLSTSFFLDTNYNIVPLTTRNTNITDDYLTLVVVHPVGIMMYCYCVATSWVHITHRPLFLLLHACCRAECRGTAAIFFFFRIFVLISCRRTSQARDLMWRIEYIGRRRRCESPLLHPEIVVGPPSPACCDTDT